MSRRGNCYDNAVVESFFGTLKQELVNRRSFATREEARQEVFKYSGTTGSGGIRRWGMSAQPGSRRKHDNKRYRLNKVPANQSKVTLPVVTKPGYNPNNDRDSVSLSRAPKEFVMRLRQFEQEEPVSSRTRISESEMQEVMELYDRQIGIAQQRPQPSDVKATSVSELPTIADVGEILGISEEEAQQLLQKVRIQKAEKSARLRESRIPPVPHMTTTAAPQVTMSGQQVTVVHNVIMDSHARLFEQFNANQGKWAPTWNWGAFWFGPLWYFYKGMWAKALMLLVLSAPLVALSGFMSPFILPILLGLIGNYDYYLLRCHGSQLWDRKPINSIPSTTIISQTPNFNVKTIPATPPTPRTNVSNAGSTGVPVNKFQVLRETYERGLFTRDEYEEKRMVLLREMEHEATLQKLDEAYKIGLLTMEEYAEKRQRLLEG